MVSAIHNTLALCITVSCSMHDCMSVVTQISLCDKAVERWWYTCFTYIRVFVTCNNAHSGNISAVISLSLPTLGRVCVPIDVALVEEFSPFEVPIVNQLCNELDESGNSEDKKPGYTYWSHKTCPFLHPWLRNKPLLLQHNVYVTHICPALSLHSPGYARTTLSTYVQHFSQFVLSLKHDPTQRRHKTRQGWYMVVKIFPLLNSFPIFFQYRSWLLTPSSTHGC